MNHSNNNCTKRSRLKLYVDVCGLPRTSSAYLHETANYNEGW